MFVANATAGIKLVADALRDYDARGFWYGYHADAHTSLVGVGGVAEQGSGCFLDDQDVQGWIEGLATEESNAEDCPILFAYPGQSNMTGRRLPVKWCSDIRDSGRKDVFSLFDAASLASTSPLDLSESKAAPDFTVVSFYKIFGFPDLGALIVRKDSGHVFAKRKYFGGGTVGMVISLGEQWHAKKTTSIHDQLEDGTLPFHSIIALDSAIAVHERLYGSMKNVSQHTSILAQTLYDRLLSLRHRNGNKLCSIYKSSENYTGTGNQGPVISFNLKDSMGNWIHKSDVEKLAAVKGIHIRSGTLCNPGGMAYHLGLTPGEMRRNYNAGQRCGDENDVINGKPTGGLRISLGAMSSANDVEKFVDFICEFYVDSRASRELIHANTESGDVIQPLSPLSASEFYVEQLCIYPIKSCGAYAIPAGIRWVVKREGLEWDREWCLIHEGTGAALNQKRYPRMALIRPTIDQENGILRITLTEPQAYPNSSIELSLSRDDPSLGRSTELSQATTKKSSTVCGDSVTVQVYSSDKISSFFSDFLGVPCTLARFPPHQHAARYSKSYKSQRQVSQLNGHDNFQLPGSMPGTFPDFTSNASNEPQTPRTQILLSNESPMLLISRSSVNKLNETIKNGTRPGSTTKAVSADVFRANIIIAETRPRISSPYTTVHQKSEQPYFEDQWSGFDIGVSRFNVLGPCQRCQMVCVDQLTAVRSEEPFSTLAKTRKVDGKVLFGRHVCLSSLDNYEVTTVTVKVGDSLTPFYE